MSLSRYDHAIHVARAHQVAPVRAAGDAREAHLAHAFNSADVVATPGAGADQAKAKLQRQPLLLGWKRPILAGQHDAGGGGVRVQLARGVLEAALGGRHALADVHSLADGAQLAGLGR